MVILSSISTPLKKTQIAATLQNKHSNTLSVRLDGLLKDTVAQEFSLFNSICHTYAITDATA